MTNSAAKNATAQHGADGSAYDAPRIYVACLAAYNNAKLHGAWIDAAQEPDDIQAEVTAMLSASPEAHAEEWALHGAI